MFFVCEIEYFVLMFDLIKAHHFGTCEYNKLEKKGEFMKKFIVGLIICGLVIAGYFIFKGESKDEQKLTKVKVGEVTHSVFYAPQYVAHSLGYFEDEGLDVEILLTSGADKVTAAVLSGDVQIGFCGSESTIYIYQQGEKDYLVNFGALTKRDGSFLVSRENIKDFTVNDLKGKKILGGREGGMPAMTLEWALNSNGISSDSTDIDTSVEFSSMSGSFIGGNGDFVTLFEPTASELVDKGYGYIVANIGELGGVVPYTAYNARKSFIENNPEIIEAFTRAIEKGLEYVNKSNNEQIANKLLPFFPDTSLNDLISSVKAYKDNNTWPNNTTFTKESFDHLQEIVVEAGQLKEDQVVNYEDLIYVR